MSEEKWDKVVSCAQLFSAECCKSINNSISPEFGQQMKTELSLTSSLQEEADSE